MASDFYDFSRAIWALPEPGEEYRLDPDGGIQWTCPSRACGVTATLDMDDDPERCSCGAAYDLEQYLYEQAEAREDEDWRRMAERKEG